MSLCYIYLEYWNTVVQVHLQTSAALGEVILPEVQVNVNYVCSYVNHFWDKVFPSIVLPLFSPFSFLPSISTQVTLTSFLFLEHTGHAHLVIYLVNSLTTKIWHIQRNK